MALHFIELLEKAYQQYPERVFIHFGDKLLTYKEAYGHIQKKILELQRLGVKPGMRVGINLPQSPELVITLLAVQCLGASIFLFDSEKLDQDFEKLDKVEQRRLKAVVKNCDFSHVVTHTEEPIRKLWAIAKKAYPLLKASTVSNENPFSYLEKDLDREAYVVTSSGSTGAPKLICISGHMLGFCQEIAEKLQEDTPNLNFNAALDVSLSFDPYLFLIYTMLSCGGGLTLAPQNESLQSRYDYYAKKGVNVMLKLPSDLISHGKYIGNAYGESQLIILSTGEDLNKPLVNKLFQSLPSLKIYNCYGPSEAGFGLTCCPILRDDAFCAIFKNSHGVFSRKLALVKIEEGKAPEFITEPGIEGEICFQNEEGEFIGYLNAEELTRKKQLKIEGERWYTTTGDLASWSVGNKVLQFRERKGMVKINGRKIDFDPIKEKLQAHSGIEQFGVTATLKEPLWILVAYTLKEGVILTSEEVLQYLSQGVYDNTAIHVMPPYDEFPQNANRKFYETKVREDFEISLKAYGKDYRKALIAYVRWFIKEDTSEEELLKSNFEELGFTSKTYMQFRTSLYHHPAFQPWPNIPEVDTSDCHGKPTEFLISTVDEALRLQDNIEMMGDERAEVLVFVDGTQSFVKNQLDSMRGVRFARFQKSPKNFEEIKKYVRTQQLFSPYLILIEERNETQELTKECYGNLESYIVAHNIQDILSKKKKYDEANEKKRCFDKLEVLQNRYRHVLNFDQKTFIKREYERFSQKIYPIRLRWIKFDEFDEPEDADIFESPRGIIRDYRKVTVENEIFPLNSTLEIMDQFYFYEGSYKVFHITGGVGSGKTTLLNKICFDILSDKNNKIKLYMVNKIDSSLDFIEKSLLRDGFSLNEIKWMKSKRMLLIVMDDIDILSTPFEHISFPEKIKKTWKNSRFLVTNRTEQSKPLKLSLSEFLDRQQLLKFKPITIEMLQSDSDFNLLVKSLLLRENGKEIIAKISSTLTKFSFDETYDSMRLLNYILDFFILDVTFSMESYIAERWLFDETKRFKNIFPEIIDNNFHEIVVYAKKLLVKMLNNESLDFHDKDWYKSNKESLLKEDSNEDVFDHNIKKHYYAYKCLPFDDGVRKLVSKILSKYLGGRIVRKNFLYSGELLQAISCYNKNSKEKISQNISFDVHQYTLSKEAFHLYNPEGTCDPIFFLPPITGRDEIGNKELKAYFPSNPVYALQHPAYVNLDCLDLNLNKQVEYYALLVNSIYPNGNIFLLGYSFGGLVASLLADKLENEYDRKVLYVGNIDARHPKLWKDMNENDFQEMICARLEWMGDKLYSDLGEVEEYKEKIRELKERKEYYFSSSKLEIVKDLKFFIEELLLENKNMKSLVVRVVLNNICCLYEDSISKVEKIYKNYYLYISSENHPLYKKADDENLGWLGIPQSRIRIIEGATHFSLLQNSHWGKLCKEIKKDLSRLFFKEENLNKKRWLKNNIECLKELNPTDYWLEPKLDGAYHTESITSALDSFILGEVKLLMLFGISGAGKSYFLRHYLAENAIMLSQRDIIPIYLIPKENLETDLKNTLPDMGLHGYDLDKLSRGYSILLIIDGINETPWLDLYFRHPFFSNRTLKIIITCTTDDYSRSLLLKLINNSSLNDLARMELYISKLDNNSIKIYLEKYKEKNCDFPYDDALVVTTEVSLVRVIDTPLSLFVFCNSFQEVSNQHPLEKYNLGEYINHLFSAYKNTDRIDSIYSDLEEFSKLGKYDFFYLLARQTLYSKDCNVERDFSTGRFTNDFSLSPCVKITKNGARFSHVQFAELFMAMEFAKDIIKGKESDLLSALSISVHPNINIFIKLFFEEINFKLSLGKSKGVPLKVTTEIGKSNLLSICKTLNFNLNNLRSREENIFKPLKMIREIPIPFFLAVYQKGDWGYIPAKIYGVEEDISPSQTYDCGLVRYGTKLCLAYNRAIIHLLPEDSPIFFNEKLKSFFVINESFSRDESSVLYKLSIKKISFNRNKVESKAEYCCIVDETIKRSSLSVVTKSSKYFVVSSFCFGILIYDQDLSLKFHVPLEKVQLFFNSKNLNLNLFNIYPRRNGSELEILFSNKSNKIFISKIARVGIFKNNIFHFQLLVEQYRLQNVFDYRGWSKMLMLTASGNMVDDDGKFIDKINILTDKLFNVFNFSGLPKNLELSKEKNFEIKMIRNHHIVIFYSSYFVSGYLIGCVKHSPFYCYNIFSFMPYSARISSAHLVGKILILTIDTLLAKVQAVFPVDTLNWKYHHWQEVYPSGYMNEFSCETILLPILYHPFWKTMAPKSYYINIPEKLFFLDTYRFLAMVSIFSNLKKHYSEKQMLPLVERLKDMLMSYKNDPINSSLTPLKKSISIAHDLQFHSFHTVMNLYSDDLMSWLSVKFDHFVNSRADTESGEKDVFKAAKDYLQMKWAVYEENLFSSHNNKLESEESLYSSFEKFCENALELEKNRKLEKFEYIRNSISSCKTSFFSHRRSHSLPSTSLFPTHKRRASFS